MPIKNCPFTYCDGGFYRAFLPIKIINPHTANSQKTYGLIDTGADECAVPDLMAPILGHNLNSGTMKIIGTGNGEAVAYSHTTTIQIFHPLTGDLIDTIENTPIDFMPVRIVLLGVKSFLSRFKLTMDYPKKVFSLEIPR